MDKFKTFLLIIFLLYFSSTIKADTKVVANKYALVEDSLYNELLNESQDLCISGDYQNALKNYLVIYDDLKSKIDKTNVEDFVATSTLTASCEINIGDYSKAATLLKNTENILTQNGLISESARPLYATLGLAEYLVGNYDDALQLCKKSKTMYETIKDTRSLDYAKLLNNMALIFIMKKDMFRAKLYADESYYLQGKNKDDNISDYQKCYILNNLAVIFIQLKQINKASHILEEIIDIARANKFYDIYALALGNYGDLQMYSHDYRKGLTLFEEALKQAKSQYIKRIILPELTIFSYLSKSPDFENYLKKYDEEEIEYLKEITRSFSFREWENYWNNLSQNLNIVNNIALPDCSDNLKSSAYNNIIFVKSMLLFTTRIFNNAASNSTNPIVRFEFDKLNYLKDKLSNRNTPIDSITNIKNSISVCQDKILSNIDMFSNINERIPNMTDITSSLKDNEVAIEFVVVPDLKLFLSNCIKSDGKITIDTVNNYYVALILKKGYRTPIAVKLCTQNELENNAFGEYGKFDSRNYDVKENKIYKLVWMPIEKYLHKNDVIYFSTFEDLNNINYHALSDGKSYLGDKYDLRRLSTTGLIPKLKEKGLEKYNDAVIYCNANYDESVNEMNENHKKSFNYDISIDSLKIMPLQRGMNSKWQSLPATKAEGHTISADLKSHNIRVRLHELNDASEESFKALDGRSPDILHIATHAFSIDYPEYSHQNYVLKSVGNTEKDKKMQSCGLLFSGSNNSWNGNPPQKAEDGILTGEEISRMDLSNTKLVVLSACGTGLGYTGFQDGIYGLQRGFKQAGVGTIIMSLWSVDDAAANVFMQYFYKFLLDGNEKHKAFDLAVSTIREKYKDPYYWAGFIMMD